MQKIVDLEFSTAINNINVAKVVKKNKNENKYNLVTENKTAIQHMKE